MLIFCVQSVVWHVRCLQPAADDDDDDDIDLFGEETEEEKKAAESREAAKASAKKKESEHWHSFSVAFVYNGQLLFYMWNMSPLSSFFP